MASCETDRDNADITPQDTLQVWISLATYSDAEIIDLLPETGLSAEEAKATWPHIKLIVDTIRKVIPPGKNSSI